MQQQQQYQQLSLTLVSGDDEYPPKLSRQELNAELDADSVVVPGETLTLSRDFIPGHGTQRSQPLAQLAASAKGGEEEEEEGEEEDEEEESSGNALLATVAGLRVTVNKLLCVLPGNSRYSGEVGDIVVGRVLEISSKRWRIDANSRLVAVLHLSSVLLPGGELRRKSEEDERSMRKMFSEGDLVSAEVQSVQMDGSLSLHTRSAKYGCLRCGQLLRVAPSLIRRSKTHFHDLPCGVRIVLGKNGYCFCGQTDTQSQPTADDCREIARVSNCLQLLANNRVQIYDTSVMTAYEASAEFSVKELLLPEVQLRVALSTVQKLQLMHTDHSAMEIG